MKVIPGLGSMASYYPHCDNALGIAIDLCHLTQYFVSISKSVITKKL